MNLEHIELVEELEEHLRRYASDFPTILKDIQDYCSHESIKLNFFIDRKVKLPKSEKKKIQNFLTSYLQGIPYEYITNHAEFYGHRFFVDPSVLVPRPETELIIDAIRDLSYPRLKAIADIGTGSGCIAISLAHIFQQTKIFAVDNSLQALSIAKINIDNHKAENVFPVQANFLDCIQNESLDVIVSNPPYISKDDPHLERLMHEPISALVSDENGLAHIKAIFKNSFQILKKDGFLVLEHGYNQANVVNKISDETGFKLIKNVKDYQDIDRIHICKK